MSRGPIAPRTIAIAICAAALLTVAHGQSKLADRLVAPLGPEDGSMFVHPHIWQSHFRFLIVLIARSAQVPIGFEEVAGEPTPWDGNFAKVPLEQRTSLLGLTVGQALDELTTADPRYGWHEQDGVLQIRPAAAARDPDHYLHKSTRPTASARRPAIDFMRWFYEHSGLEVTSSTGGVIGDPQSSGFDLHKPVAVSGKSASILETLNAVVRAHGKLGWLVHYGQGPATLRNSCIRLITFDGHFQEVSAIRCAASY